LGFDGSVGVSGVAPASELVVLDDVLKKCRVEQEDADEFATNARSSPRLDEGIRKIWLAKLEGLGIEVRIIGINRDAHALAAEHEPEDSEFPVLETVDVRMRMGVKIEERTGSDQVFAATLAGGEEERNVGNLFSQDIDGAINPDDLLVGVLKRWGGT